MKGKILRLMEEILERIRKEKRGGNRSHGHEKINNHRSY